MSDRPVEIYTKWGCPYCVRAKALLDAKGVAYQEYDITLGGPKKAEMLERVPGASTVPQILIAGQAIGDRRYELAAQNLFGVKVSGGRSHRTVDDVQWPVKPR